MMQRSLRTLFFRLLLPAVFAFFLSAEAHCGSSPTKELVIETDEGNFTEKNVQISPDGLHVAMEVCGGKKMAVDGKTGPEFEEIYKHITFSSKGGRWA